MLIYPTTEGALREGNYWRVVFKFATFGREWFPTLHLFDDLEDAQEKMDELNKTTGGILHKLSALCAQKQPSYKDVTPVPALGVLK